MMDYIRVALEQFNQIMESRDEGSEPFPFDSFEDYFDMVIEPSGRYPELRILRGEPYRGFEMDAIEIMKAGPDWYNLSEYPDEWFSTVFAPRGWIPEGGSRYVPFSSHGQDFWFVVKMSDGRWTVLTMFDNEIGRLNDDVFYALTRDARRHPRTVKALAEMNSKLIRAGKRYDPIKFLIEDTSNPRWK